MPTLATRYPPVIVPKDIKLLTTKSNAFRVKVKSLLRDTILLLNWLVFSLRSSADSLNFLSSSDTASEAPSTVWLKSTNDSFASLVSSFVESDFFSKVLINSSNASLCLLLSCIFLATAIRYLSRFVFNFSLFFNNSCRVLSIANGGMKTDPLLDPSSGSSNSILLSLSANRFLHKVRIL